MSSSNSADGSRTGFDCAECEYEIRPGDARVPASDGAVHVSCSVLRETQDAYSFFITNPAEEEMYGYSLWFDAGDREYPIFYNTGGLDSFASAAKTFGDNGRIQPTASFFEAIGYTFHWLQSYRPLPDDVDRIHGEIEKKIPKHYPNERVPHHEKWALYRIITYLYRAPAVQPEWGPIVEYCDTLTEFQVPDVRPYSED
jgi:hypothetical protein